MGHTCTFAGRRADGRTGPIADTTVRGLWGSLKRSERHLKRAMFPVPLTHQPSLPPPFIIEALAAASLAAVPSASSVRPSVRPSIQSLLVVSLDSRQAGDEAKGKGKEEVAGCLIIEAVIGLQLQVRAHSEIEMGAPF